jgi:tight adherence protein C
MTGAALLAAGSVLLLAAAARDLPVIQPYVDGALAWAERTRRRSGSSERARLFDVQARLSRAGLTERVTVPGVFVLRGFGALAGFLAGVLAAPAAPGRLFWLVLLGLPAAGLFAPDALIERAARRRHERMLAELPDALDRFAVSAAGGRSSGASLAELAADGAGPLATEMGIAVAELSAGRSQEQALGSLRARVGGAQIAGLVAAIERSRRYGSPLAEQLRRQASSLRVDQRRAVQERAARAAPKIQLVVALVLVPSVLLMIAAGLLANSDVLLGAY